MDKIKMNNMDYCLVEDFNPEFDYGKINPVALTPEAYYQMQKRLIHCASIDSYYNESDLVASEDAYFFQRLEWMERLDQYLKSTTSHFNGISIGPHRTYYKFFKQVVDSVIIASYILSSFIRKTKPRKIIYLCKKSKSEGFHSGFTVLPPAERPAYKSLYLQLLPLICKANGIPFYLVGFQEASPSDQEKVLEPVKANIKDVVKSSMFFKPGVSLYRRFADIRNYELLNLLKSKSPKTGKIRIMFNRLDDKLVGLVASLLEHGHEVYIKQGKSILKCTPFGLRSVTELKIDGDSKLSRQISDACSIAAKEIGTQENLFNWVNHRCGFDVRELIVPKFESFINNQCREFLFFINEFKEFYKKYRIDFVVTMFEVFPDEFAMISAASLNGATKTIHLQHGETIYPMSPIGEFDRYDYYFSSEQGIDNYLKRVAGDGYLKGCQVHQASFRYTEYKDVRLLRKNKPMNPKKKTVVFVPKICTWDKRYFNFPYYSPTWHYKLQKAIVELFAQRHDYEFIFKAAPQSDHIRNPMGSYILDKAFPNIRVSSSNLIDHLKRADRVIIDYPSTPMYEAAAAEVPMLVLRPQAYKSRDDEVLNLFSVTLQPFTDIDDAIVSISNFLNDDPKKYIIRLPEVNSDMRGVLEALANQSGADIRK